MHIKQHNSYSEASSSYEDLCAAHDKIQARIAEIHLILKQPQHLEREKKTSVSAALKFLKTGVIEPTSFDRHELAEELHVLHEQERSVKSAINPAYQRRESIKSDLSAAYCRTGDIAERHKKIARLVIQKLNELDSLFKDEQALVVEVESKGYNASLPLLAFRHELGRINGEYPNKTLMDNMIADLSYYCMSQKERESLTRQAAENQRKTDEANKKLRANSAYHGVIDLGEA
jgi:DNA gyrase/topoisomerase IV subunit A